MPQKRRRSGCLKSFFILFVVVGVAEVALGAVGYGPFAPTHTPTPTDTPTITLTPSATLTPRATLTPSITLTPTITPTLTPSMTPTSTYSAADFLTVTAAQYNFGLTSTIQSAIDDKTATADQRLQNATDAVATRTQVAFDAQTIASATAEQRQNDASATNDARTSVASDRQSTLDFISSFTAISPNELTTYPDKHFGEDVVVHGRVLTVDSSGHGALQVTLSNGQTIVVQLAPIAVLDGIYPGDNVTVYGTVSEVFTGKNLAGVTISESKLILGIVTKP